MKTMQLFFFYVTYCDSFCNNIYLFPVITIGWTELDDVCDALDIDIETDIEEAGYGETTLSGLLCAVAGRIPSTGDNILFAGYVFTVLELEHDRVILNTSVRRIVESDVTGLVEGKMENVDVSELGSSRFDNLHVSEDVNAEDVLLAAR